MLSGFILVFGSLNSYNDPTMAARTCLLCGKPLSRIRAGTTEDFCSQEHRNQYRLRQGMDRLLEANKVASVMRRRESPKQIPAGQLRSPGPASPRAFLTPARPPAPPLAIRAPRVAGKPKLTAVSRYLKAEVSVGGQAESRAAGQARFAGQPARAPKVPVRLAAHVMAAPAARLRPQSGEHTEACSTAIRWLGPGKPAIGRLLAQAERRTAGPMSASRPALRMTAPSRGRALRVSTSATFGLPVKALPATRYTAEAADGLPSRGPKRLNGMSVPAKMEPLVEAIETEPAEMRLPPPPTANFQRRFQWPGAFETTMKFRDAANEARVSAVPFARPEEFAAKERK
jgi:hypothetical protein